MTLTPDKKEKLKQTIAGMRSICSEGRKEVTTLIETLIGEPLTPPRKDICVADLRIGDVYALAGGLQVCLLADFGGYWFITGRDTGPISPRPQRFLIPFSDSFGTSERNNSAQIVVYLNSNEAKKVGHIETRLALAS